MRHARFTALARAELLAEVSYYENRRTGLGADGAWLRVLRTRSTDEGGPHSPLA